MHVRKEDQVVIIVGKDRKKVGKVLTSFPKTNRVIVEGINIQKRHTKPKSAQQPGGIIEKAGAIHVSNVQVICPKCKKPTRISNVIEADGTKHRACKHCQENLDKKKEKEQGKDVAAKKTADKKVSVKKNAETGEKADSKKTDDQKATE